MTLLRNNIKTKLFHKNSIVTHSTYSNPCIWSLLDLFQIHCAIQTLVGFTVSKTLSRPLRNMFSFKKKESFHKSMLLLTFTYGGCWLFSGIFPPSRQAIHSVRCGYQLAQSKLNCHLEKNKVICGLLKAEFNYHQSNSLLSYHLRESQRISVWQ